MAWLNLNFQLETIDTTMSLSKISPKTPHRFTTHTKTADEVGGGGGTHYNVPSYNYFWMRILLVLGWILTYWMWLFKAWS